MDPSYLLTLPDDVLFMTLLYSNNMNLKQIYQLCSQYKTLDMKICDNERSMFWKLIYERDLSEVVKPPLINDKFKFLGRSYYQAYRLLVRQIEYLSLDEQLRVAARKGYEKLVSNLMNRGADPLKRPEDSYDDPPFEDAIFVGNHPHVVRVMLHKIVSNATDPFYIDLIFNFPIHLLFDFKHNEITLLLWPYILDINGPPDEPYIVDAVNSDNYEIVEKFLTDPRLMQQSLDAGFNQAIVTNNYQLAELLLQSIHINPNHLEVNINQYNYLKDAAAHGNSDLLQLLIDYGIDLDLYGSDALTEAFNMDSYTVIRDLLNQYIPYGINHLQIAIDHDNLESADALIKFEEIDPTQYDQLNLNYATPEMLQLLTKYDVVKNAT